MLINTTVYHRDTSMLINTEILQFLIGSIHSIVWTHCVLTPLSSDGGYIISKLLLLLCVCVIIREVQ